MTLALLAAIVPFATDFYLPAFPKIALAFGVGSSGVQLSLMTFLLGAALGQLFFGPVSDRYGRRWPLIGGVVLCALASAATALAPTLHFLVVARFVQGLSGATGMVMSRAIVQDLATDERHAARANNIVTSVLGIAPIIGPWLGSILAGPLGWRGTLWAVCAILVLTLLAVLAFVRESHPATRRAAHKASSLESGQSPLRALGSRGFIGNTLIYCAVFAVLMAFISASPFLLQTMIGLSVIQYGWVFAGIALVMAVASAISAHLAMTVTPGRQLRVSTPLMLVSTLAFLGVAWSGVAAVWLLLPLMAVVACVGFSLGNAASSAITSVPHSAGMGAAILGALQFGFGALVAPLVGVRGANSAMPLALVLVVSAALATLAYRVIHVQEPAAGDGRAEADRGACAAD